LNPVRWKYLSAVLFALSVLFLASVAVLPNVKSAQDAVYRGPAGSYAGGDTAVSGYYIPTVDVGSKVSVSIENFVPGTIDISIFPSQAGAIAPVPGSVPVYVKSPLFNQTATFRANSTQPYGVYVISRNNTRFTLVVMATYSPYYWLTAYNSVGVFLSFATAILFYYYGFTARRWRLEQRELREATRTSRRVVLIPLPPIQVA